MAHPLTLAAGRCTTVLALGGRGAGAFVARLVDERGQVLDEHDGVGVGKPGQATLRACPEEPLQAQVELVARGGGGPYALDVLTKPVPADLLRGIGAQARAGVLDAIEDASLAGWASPGPAEAVDLPARLSLTVGAGQCERIEAVVDEGKLELSRGGGATGVRHVGRRASTWLCGPTEAHIDLRGHGTTRAYWLRLRRPHGDGSPAAGAKH